MEETLPKEICSQKVIGVPWPEHFGNTPCCLSDILTQLWTRALIKVKKIDPDMEPVAAERVDFGRNLWRIFMEAA
jgi:hypothetical protein